MDQLSQEFLDSCRRDSGRVLRGESMSRIETFVDAAFAFAFTMLVISIDEIPRSPQELFELSRDIPAFILSAMLIGTVWLAHSNWSRTFGLQDSITIYLSLALVMLVLIFVYPIKLMMQSTVVYMSLVVFDTDLFDNGLFENAGWANNEVADLFVYFASGLIALALITIAFYLNSLRYRVELRLNGFEISFCRETILDWILVIATALVSIVTALNSDAEGTAMSGFVYFSLFFTLPLARFLYRRYRSGKVIGSELEGMAQEDDAIVS